MAYKFHPEIVSIFGLDLHANDNIYETGLAELAGYSCAHRSNYPESDFMRKQIRKFGEEREKIKSLHKPSVWGRFWRFLGGKR